jgi:tetratricopeptide (TPR) repeat protein
LVAIEKESKIAYDILRLLCFLGPDLITKPLIRHLLQKSSEQNLLSQEYNDESCSRQSAMNRCITVGLVLCIPIVIGSTVLSKRQSYNSNQQKIGFLAAILSPVLSGLVVARTSFPTSVNEDSYNPQPMEGIKRSRSFTFSATEYEEADIVWDILKSYSILTVKEGKGSMHRLLAQALRSSQTVSEWRSNLRICLEAMQSMWTFNPEEIETWKESLQVLEHVKSVASHSRSCNFACRDVLNAGRLSTEAGVFSAMSLNAFIEAQQSFEISISLFDNANECKKPAFQKARAKTLHELGRVFRYQGKYLESQRSLQEALSIYEKFSSRDADAKHRVADTLHELGVLEVKKHELDSATQFLQKSLEMRKTLNEPDLKSAATLHQLAAIMVARKPPSLEKAKSLLQEALGLSRHIGQRAATLKQLARVTIRQGALDRAESYLEQALDLYKELYGENKNHINIAAVKFQQGALALQSDQWEQAWMHFSECLRIRKSVYAYARPVGSDHEENPTHLEVSCVLHELARVAFAQGYFSQAMDTLKSEQEILKRLEETSDHHTERICQARLTNLTWLRKCAKEMGDEDSATNFSTERSNLKKFAANRNKQEDVEETHSRHSETLIDTCMNCRLAARKFALERDKNGSKLQDLNFYLEELCREINNPSSCTSLKSDAVKFRDEIVKWKDQPGTKRRGPMLEACDDMRDVLRANGYQVSDSISSRR